MEALVFARGLGSSKPNPMSSTGSAYFSSSSAMSIAEGCRRMKFEGLDVERTGEMVLFRFSRACIRTLFPKLLKDELGDDLTEEAAVEQLIVLELFRERCRGL